MESDSDSTTNSSDEEEEIKINTKEAMKNHYEELRRMNREFTDLDRYQRKMNRRARTKLSVKNERFDEINSDSEEVKSQREKHQRKRYGII